MKATIDLPHELALRLKITAASRGKRVKAVAAETFRTALVLLATSTEPRHSVRHRVQLPLIVAPPGAPKFSLTGEDIDRLLMEDEIKSHHDAARH